MAKKLPAGMTMRADGRIVNRFTIEGKRYVVYGKNVKECRERESEKRIQINEGLLIRGRDKTVSEYFDEWIAAKGGHRETDHNQNRPHIVKPYENYSH